MNSPHAMIHLIEPALSEQAALTFAITHITSLLNQPLESAFYFAGGAFKSLLHGRPPRDLDLWPVSPEDRLVLIKRLTQRGARVHHDNPPFQTTFTLSGATLEVAYDCSSASLEELLAHFDIALSAVGVEYQRGVWRALVHPSAQESIRRREVLLLKPLVNWKYALVTLVRLRRYAEELGYSVPPSEEETIWSVFDAQPRSEQERLIERFQRIYPDVSSPVLQEARCRLRP